MNKEAILKARGIRLPSKGVKAEYFPPPKSLGGCAEPTVEKFEGSYKLVIDTNYPVCDSITTWTSMGIDYSVTWGNGYPSETEWYYGHPEKIETKLLAEPSVAAIATNFISFLVRSSKDGFKTVSKDTFIERLTICRGCPYWDDSARMGIGKCNHPKCGCTKLKHHLASQSCPQNFWGPSEEYLLKHQPKPL